MACTMKTITKKRKASKMEVTSSCWQWLPVELLEVILEMLVSLSDYIQFGAVCRHWQSTALHQKQKRAISCQNKQLPLLLIPAKKKISNRLPCGLYNATIGKTFVSTTTFDLNSAYNANRFSGSSHGWLACVDDNLAIMLVNPFSRRTISLPPLHPKTTYCFQRRSFRGEYYMNKVVLSANPDSAPGSFETLVIYGTSKIAHFKSGDADWNHIDLRISFDDILYYRGQFLAVSSYGEVFTVNINVDIEMTVPYLTASTDLPKAPSGGKNKTYQHYLVESSGGDLLLVRKFGEVDFHKRSKVTLSFKVFKLLCASENDRVARWIEVKRMDKEALFLGTNQSICVSILDFLGCQPNLIHFTDDSVDASFHVSQRAQDMGVYNLETKKISRHYLDASLKELPPAVWIVPTLIV